MTRAVCDDILTVECPRLSFDDGVPCECAGEIRLDWEYDGEYTPETRWTPEEEPVPVLTTVVWLLTCTHGDTPEIPFTAVEKEELQRRADLAMRMIGRGHYAHCDGRSRCRC